MLLLRSLILCSILRINACINRRSNVQKVGSETSHKSCLSLLFYFHLFLQAHYSTGRVSASFTSTAMTPATIHEAGKWTSHKENPLQKATFTSSFFCCFYLYLSREEWRLTTALLQQSAALYSHSWMQLQVGAAPFDCVFFSCQPLSCSMGEICCYATV